MKALLGSKVFGQVTIPDEKEDEYKDKIKSEPSLDLIIQAIGEDQIVIVDYYKTTREEWKILRRI